MARRRPLCALDSPHATRTSTQGMYRETRKYLFRQSRLLNYHSPSCQIAVPCNGEYRRQVMNAEPSTICKFKGALFCQPEGVQLWQKRVAVLCPLRSNHLQTHTLISSLSKLAIVPWIADKELGEIGPIVLCMNNAADPEHMPGRIQQKEREEYGRVGTSNREKKYLSTLPNIPTQPTHLFSVPLEKNTFNKWPRVLRENRPTRWGNTHL